MAELDIDVILENIRSGMNQAVDAHRRATMLSTPELSLTRDRLPPIQNLDAHLSAEIKRLQAIHSEVKQRIAVDSALLAPWRLIPSELWSEIFLLAVPEDWTKRNGWRAGHRFLSFAQVCAAWRIIAFSTPLLWNYIDISICDAHECPSAEERASLEAEISRTGQAPLDLVITMSEKAGQVEEQYLTPQECQQRTDYWAVLRAQTHRWRDVTIYGLPRRLYASLAGCSFPILRRLGFGLEMERIDLPPVSPLEIFRTAPMLRAIGVYFMDVPIPPPGYLILPSSWSNIEEMDLRRQNSRGPIPEFWVYLDAFFSCSRTLRVCRLNAQRLGDIPRRLAVTTFPRLEVLELLHAANHLLPYMITLSLKTVTLRTDSDGACDVVTLHSDLLDRSTAWNSLQSLGLLYVVVDSAQLVGCLRRLDNLTTLTLRERDWRNAPETRLISQAFVAALARAAPADADEDQIFLPRLERLTLSFQYARDYAKEHMIFNVSFARALLAALESRRRPLVWRGEKLPGLQYLTMPVLYGPHRFTPPSPVLQSPGSSLSPPRS
ncbi:uncharacterized protein SCHCODRAFT_02616300 [Schizophyllum commune H4-8]|uniref:uncharacterized protein n=1 Tax=Schizophyllum commune (strain H4-8 / FGSC 9210) TaxID=578458 RepID=UPI00215F4058|nr:uncharacterized protein SCHCODRAFT_02616300 [Schizophyllum commune H4-8]KAI5896954.1 hypothetical protein SCHCODRAFT_02616300 [Schizophyllum commune H4-8]